MAGGPAAGRARPSGSRGAGQRRSPSGLSGPVGMGGPRGRHRGPRLRGRGRLVSATPVAVHLLMREAGGPVLARHGRRPAARHPSAGGRERAVARPLGRRSRFPGSARAGRHRLAAHPARNRRGWTGLVRAARGARCFRDHAQPVGIKVTARCRRGMGRPREKRISATGGRNRSGRAAEPGGCRVAAVRIG